MEFKINGLNIVARDIIEAAFKAAEIRSELNEGENLDPWAEEDAFWAAELEEEVI